MELQWTQCAYWDDLVAKFIASSTVYCQHWQKFHHVWAATSYEIAKKFLVYIYMYIYIYISNISSINTASLISTPVRYYLNMNNIDIVVIFISSTPLNSTICHFTTEYCIKLLCNDDNFINHIRLITSKYRGNIINSILNMQLTHILIKDSFK